MLDWSPTYDKAQEDELIKFYFTESESGKAFAKRDSNQTKLEQLDIILYEW